MCVSLSVGVVEFHCYKKGNTPYMGHPYPNDVENVTHIH